MARRIILTIMEGSFTEGFPIILRIGRNNAITETELEIPGKLPPAPHIPEAVKDWQKSYYQVVRPYSRIKPKPGQVTNVSCKQAGKNLAKDLNNWLNSGSREWQKIRDGLQRNLRETEEIQVLIQTDDSLLRQIPWHTWNLFSDHYKKSEIALSAPEYKLQTVLIPPTKKLRILAILLAILHILVPRTKKLRILAILGDSTGINVQEDKKILKKLPHTEEPFFLEQPQLQQLTAQLWEQQWQVLFFAGHSCSQEEGKTGRIYINSTDSLSIEEFKKTLERAIAHGLQLAIFNSCDGLGLARELADLQIPQIVVMREPVPDLVAQEFLKYFLENFSQGKSLYLAVREARERLEELHSKFPYASWLPVIFQNPAVEPLTWEKLRRSNIKNHGLERIYKPLLLVLVSSLISSISTLQPARHIAWNWIQNRFYSIPSNHWKAEYFNKPIPKDAPISPPQDLGDCNKPILLVWGTESPSETLQDNFSAQITTKCYFPKGLNLLKIKADDGSKVKVGEQTIIDELTNERGCKDQENHDHAEFFYSEGREYPVTVEYCERDGYAQLLLNIKQHNFFEESVNPIKEWQATFYRWDKNRPRDKEKDEPPKDFYKKETEKLGILNLGSNQRSDTRKGLEQYWKASSPKDDERLSTDFILASMSTKANFKAGKKYRVVVKAADDGFQLLVRNPKTAQLTFITPENSWQKILSTPKEFSLEVPHNGIYDFYFLHYERDGHASIDFFWEESTPLCSGVSCIGRDPHDNKCDISSEPQVVTSTVGNFQPSEGNLETFQVRMKYSKECNATWVWSTAPFLSTHYLEDRHGNQYGKADIPQDRSPYHYSDMGPGNIELKACAQILNKKPTCTNFVKL
ncbi:CHAT domain-containing protein [Leptolyngbya sp. FACHB-321]|uniref:CHAT domain-containing protein n=1 Tax=Leptolyngbya sp. FACHB-321 TaxID=2692807 RepID=UPI001681F1EC|nr:CHAT domain-containing protein [Leptolyngbya sp. FACHB-321]MBD2038239.1 CHAT domain-containing protein [Leptolyngbya sp. FACHB-321]